VTKLLPHHAKLLRDSAIADDVAATRGYVSVNGETSARLKELGFSRAQRSTPGLLIPVHGVDGSIKTHQYRPDTPRIDSRGRSRKYETPYLSRLALDVPPAVRTKLGDVTIPLWITEGVRNADASVSVGSVALV
jgi:hypothetical protein